VSRAVHEQVVGKVEVTFTDSGLCNLKNIDAPVQVFRVGGAGEGLPALISERPSIAVLPFDCLSEDRDIRLLADGLVEDVIALLARVAGFFVIARSSSFAYRNTTQDIRQVGRELGVRYVVEGIFALPTDVREFRPSSSKPRAGSRSGRIDLTRNWRIRSIFRTKSRDTSSGSSSPN
jgi:hypothetical protein